jgi:hypothetical protein
MNDGDESNEKKVKSTSYIVGHRRALRALYAEVGKEALDDWDEHIELDLKNLIDGYMRTINDLKKRGLIKIKEGKRHLKWNAYSMLAKKLMQQQTKRGQSGQSWNMVTFAWAFFVLTWNLMSRGDSVETIMLQHIEWCEDALVIEEQGHNGDQTGEEKYGKHIYANPKEPHVCPILSLAVLVYSTPQRRKGGRQQLFVGTNSKYRFHNLFHERKKSLNEEELQILGCAPNDIGTHSLRVPMP